MVNLFVYSLHITVMINILKEIIKIMYKKNLKVCIESINLY